MKIIRKKEGGIDIVFSCKEILTLILKKRTFKIDHESLKNATFEIIKFQISLHEDFDDYLKELEKSPEYHKFVKINKDGSNKNNR